MEIWPFPDPSMFCSLEITLDTGSQIYVNIGNNLDESTACPCDLPLAPKGRSTRRQPAIEHSDSTMATIRKRISYSHQGKIRQTITRVFRLYAALR